MPLSSDTHAISPNALRPLIRHSILLLLTLFLLVSALAAQGNQEAVQRLIMEGRQLIAAGTRVSFQQAIRKFEQVRLLYRAARDAGGEADALSTIGFLYKELGEGEKALDNYLQCLPLYRSVGNHYQEAVALIYVGSIYNDAGDKQQALTYYTQALPAFRAARDRKGEAFVRQRPRPALQRFRG